MAEPDTRTPVFLAIVATVLGILLLRELRDVFLPIVCAVLLFYALDPIVDWMARAIPRLLATIIVLLTLVSGVGIAVYTLSGETMAVVEELPQAARQLRATLNSRQFRAGTFGRMRQAAQELERTASEVAGTAPPGSQAAPPAPPPVRVSDYIWSGSMSTLAVAGQVVVILFLAAFLIQSDELYRQKIIRIVGPRLTDKKITLQALISIEEQIKQFLGVQIFTSTLVGVATWIALWALGLEHAPVWGFFAAAMNWIPYFGPLAVTVLLTIVAWMQFATYWDVAAVAGTALAITTLEGFLITPYLLGRAAQMNQVAVFVSLLFWSWLWGAFGTLLAIPIMMAIKVTCDHVEALSPLGEFLSE